jgi:L-arginine dehydrogenase
MSTPIVLGRDDAKVDEAGVLAAVRDAFGELAAGRAVQPVQVVSDLPGGGDVIAYQAVLPDAGVYAVKVSPYLPQPGGNPIVTAWTLLVSTATGAPVLLADAGALTVERTAATTALAVDLLARPGARTLAVIGLGAVGRAHVRYARAVRPFDDVRVFSPSAGSSPVDGATLAGSAAEAVDGADVVLLCTSAAEPVVDVRALAPGVLVTSISTNAPRAHEIDPAALRELDVYCDFRPAALASAGDFRLARLGDDDVRGDLPGLLSGVSPAPSGERPAYFRSVGLGIEDAAVALAALGKAAVR